MEKNKKVTFINKHLRDLCLFVTFSLGLSHIKQIEKWSPHTRCCSQKCITYRSPWCNISGTHIHSKLSHLFFLQIMYWNQTDKYDKNYNSKVKPLNVVLKCNHSITSSQKILHLQWLQNTHRQKKQMNSRKSTESKWTIFKNMLKIHKHTPSSTGNNKNFPRGPNKLGTWFRHAVKKESLCITHSF